MKDGLVALARLLRWQAGVLLLYLILHPIFGRLTEDGGLVTPDGSVSLGVAFLGILVLLLRLGVLFVLPAMIAYRVVSRLFRAAG